MTDNYDPDQFDWGDAAPGIDLDDVGPDIVESAMHAALDAHEEAFGWRYLKRSERKEGAGRLFRVQYYMPEEKRAFFETEFPGYTFVWDGARGHHDHPAAHLCTELNEIEMVEPLVKSGKMWIDLFGNGLRDRKYKRKCLNMYALNTPKDYLRYQKLGATDIAFNLARLCDPDDRLGQIEDITCTHALYYLSLEDIGRIVNTSRGRRLRAIVHRHKETRGELNAGEQVYVITEDGLVQQENVATGERYEHPSLEALFHQYSATTSHGGVAWTVNKAGGDSYIMDFVGCPAEICAEYKPLKFLKEKSWEEFQYKGISVKKFLHWTWMSARTTQGSVRLEDVDLFAKLRRYVAGKQRNPRLKTETMNYARRLCNKADIISIHGGGAHEIPVASMADYVEVAFYVDVRTELDVALSFYKENRTMVHALNDYYGDGRVPTDMTLITGAAVISGKALTAGATKVIDAVRLMEKQQRANLQYIY